MSVSAGLVAVLFLGGVQDVGAQPPPGEDPAPGVEQAASPEAAPPAAPSPEVAPPERAPSDAAPPQLTPEPRFESVVVGTSEARTSGSLHVIKPEKLERYELDNAQSILQTVPGVYARGEDGFGLRPNIGLRGANPDRSKKVTLLEDGILFGPAPYSAPAAYFFPLMTRMVSVRVLKGPSSIQQGPQTVGGSVDFLSRDIPSTDSFGLDVAGGQYGYGKVHGHVGTSTERLGFLLEGVHLRSDGFKELDGGPDRGFQGGGNTGFRKNEWVAKTRYRLVPEGPLRQSLQLKLSYSDEVSDETYLGLSDADFRANPLRRYGASRTDRMVFFRTQGVLSHVLEADGFVLTTSAYRQDINRRWRKVNRFRGASIADVLADPTSARNSIYYAVLTGQEDSATRQETLMIGPNHRVFVSQGLQSVGRWSTLTGPVRHDVEVGARLHYDRIDRLHTEDGFRSIGGQWVPDGEKTDVTADNKDSTTALALHALDAASWGRLTVTPGVRVELIGSRSEDRLLSQVDRGALAVVLPGVGVHGALTPELGLFGGVYRGFSPPAPGQPEAVRPEESTNYEGGARWTRRGERFELVGFFNDYANLTDVCTFSNGCLNENLDRQFDAGRAHIYGLEAYADKTVRTGWGLSFPLSLAYTYTQTQLLETFSSGDPQFGAVRAGDELPYVPRHQLFASAGVEGARWGAFVNANFVDVMREQAGQGEIPANVKTDALLTFDVNGSYQLTRWGQLYVSVRNVTNELGIVGRRPFGARPNAPRTGLVGFKISL